VWRGLKGGEGKPMIQIVNEMIERTSRILNLPKEDVLRGFIRANMPMFSVGGAGVGLSQIMDQSDQSQQ
jgi:hypothetical protein